MNSIVEAPPVPDEECGSLPILGAGVLDVPPEIWGQFHNRFRDVRTASYFELVYRCRLFSECITRLGNKQVSSLLWVPKLSAGYPFITINTPFQMSGNYFANNCPIRRVSTMVFYYPIILVSTF